MTKYNLLESQFIDYNLFKTMYSIFYFDLAEQMTDSMFSGTIKINFYTCYLLFLHISIMY